MRHVFLVLSLLISFATNASDENTHAAPMESMVVATKLSPPFAFKTADGSWTGISIELWERVAKELDLPPPSFRELPLEQMFDELQQGKVSAAIAAISVTPEREHRMDFSHPYYSTGLGVAVSSKQQGGLLRSVASRLFTWQALSVIGGTVTWLLLIGVFFWLLERRTNPLFKDQGMRKGLALGFWWATTILLGNKSVLPTSVFSRALVIGGMVTSILLLVTFTGAIASYLTVSQLDRNIRQPEDLRHLRVVTLSDTTSEAFLRRLHAGYQAVPDLTAGMQAVERGRADAIVYDAPALKFLVNTEYTNRLEVLSFVFQRQEYAIALPRGSQLRKPINETLLQLRQEKWWDDLIYRYLGESS
jgi:ABC-type amino acid transport substrate-binding protein